MMKLFSGGLVGVCILGAGLPKASAAPILFEGTNGSLAAQVSIDIVNVGGSDRLQVELTNTSSADVMVPADVLTGVFFNIEGDVALTPISAMLASGSHVYQSGALVTQSPMAGPDIGGEWAFKAGINGPGDTNVGVSSAGLGIFGPGDRFNSADLDPPPNVGGLNYGLLSAGDDVTTGNGGVLPIMLAKNGAVFQFGNLPAGFNLSAIKSVMVQYGTSVTEPTITTHNVPEPATLGLLAPLATLALRRRRH